MRSIIVSILLLIVSLQLQAQSSFKLHPELSWGLSIPQGKEFSAVHATGLNGALTIYAPVAKDLYLGPSAMLQYHRKNLNGSTKDVLIGTSFGGMMEYFLNLRNRQWFICPQFGMYSQKVKDYLAPKSGYRGEALDVLTGKDIAYVFGCGITYKRYRFLVHYKLFKPEVVFDDGISAEFLKYNNYYTIFRVTERYPMDFSSIMISTAFRL